jgi:hypothetical protein
MVIDRRYQPKPGDAARKARTARADARGRETCGRPSKPYGRAA